MAVHIVCGYANLIGASPGILGGAAWSETLTSPGVAPKAAPELGARAPDLPGNPTLLFQVDPDADVWVAIGSKGQADPDATQDHGAGPTARWKVRAGRPQTFFCMGGARIAWAPVA